MRNVMKKAWEIARAGQKKFGGQIKEYFAQALKMAWAIAKKVMKSVELIGSEKQVKWAESIRKNFVAMLEDALATVKSNEVKKWVGATCENGIETPIFEDSQIFATQEKFNEVKVTVEKIIEAANSIESAKFFIENKEKLSTMIARESDIKRPIVVSQFLKAHRRITDGEIVYK